MQCNSFYFVAGRVNFTSIKYGYDSFLWAIDADANENVSGKNITSHSYKIIAKQQKKLNWRAGYSFYRNFSTTRINNRQSLGNLELTGGRLPIVSNIIVENPSDHCLVMATLLFCIFLEKVNTGFT